MDLVVKLKKICVIYWAKWVSAGTDPIFIGFGILNLFLLEKNGVIFDTYSPTLTLYHTFFLFVNTFSQNFLNLFMKIFYEYGIIYENS